MNGAVELNFSAKLLAALTTARLIGDSRQVNKGDIFICHRASEDQHHHFIKQALVNQAAYIITQQLVDAVEYQSFSAQLVTVPDVKQALDQLTGLKYGFSETEFFTVAVTGTNGKSSVAWMLSAMYLQLEPAAHCLYLGTLGVYLDGKALELPIDAPAGFDTKLTSLDLVHLRYLLRFVNDKYPHAKKYLICEVSSHAIDQQRTGSIVFDQVLLTNLASDHLDYHHTIQAYHDCKLSLLSKFKAAFALVNHDCHVIASKVDQLIKNQALCPIQTVGFGENCQFKLLNSSNNDSNIATDSGYCLVQPTKQLRVVLQNKLLTENSIALQNLVMVVAALMIRDFAPNAIEQAVQKLENPPGRFQIVNHQPLCMVDFAHSEAALANALQIVKGLIEGELWVVFGCGGDRDKNKRPAMGKCAQQYADHIMITHDNNRSETFNAIEKDISSELVQKYSICKNRKPALEYVLGQMKLGDGLLVAGMGPDSWCDDEDMTLSTDATVIKQWFSASMASTTYTGDNYVSI